MAAVAQRLMLLVLLALAVGLGINRAHTRCTFGVGDGATCSLLASAT